MYATKFQPSMKPIQDSFRTLFQASLQGKRALQHYLKLLEQKRRRRNRPYRRQSKQQADCHCQVQTEPATNQPRPAKGEIGSHPERPQKKGRAIHRDFVRRHVT